MSTSRESACAPWAWLHEPPSRGVCHPSILAQRVTSQTVILSATATYFENCFARIILVTGSLSLDHNDILMSKRWLGFCYDDYGVALELSTTAVTQALHDSRLQTHIKRMCVHAHARACDTQEMTRLFLY